MKRRVAYLLPAAGLVLAMIVIPGFFSWFWSL